MSSDEIPDSAMQAAIAVRENWCGHTVVVVGDDEGCQACRSDGLTREIARALHSYAEQRVAEAVRMERETCAKIADAESSLAKRDQAYSTAYDLAAVASRIRARGDRSKT